LLGKVYCKVDAQHGSIQIGDFDDIFYIWSYHEADDPLKAFGAVIGKALGELTAPSRPN
jgi:hypothetical protein